jgi:hypothetical protein
MERRWKTWHKVTLGVLVGLNALCWPVACASMDDRPKPAPSVSPSASSGPSLTPPPVDPTTAAPTPPASIEATRTAEAQQGAYYASCAAARAAGAAPLHQGDPGYSRKLDRDGDGTACE